MPATPSFSVQPYRSHRRIQSEGSGDATPTRKRMSTSWDAHISQLTKTSSAASGRLGHSVSVTSSTSKKQKPTLTGAAATNSSSPSTNTTSSTSANNKSERKPIMSRSSSLSIPRSAVSAAFRRHSFSKSSQSVSEDSTPKTPPMPVGTATPSLLQRKRPPKKLMEPYGEGFYGLANLSDNSLSALSDEEDEPQETPRRRSLDAIEEEFGEDVQELIRATNKAFEAVGSSLDDYQLGSPAIRASADSQRKHFSYSKPETLTRKDSPSSSESGSSTKDSVFSSDSLNKQTTNYSVSDTSEIHTADSPVNQAPSQVPPKPELKSHWSESSTEDDTTPSQLPSRTFSSPVTRDSGSNSSRASGAMRKRKTKSPTQKASGRLGHAKWNLSEGVHDILTGHRFKKPEVEELLTPDRLAQLKRKRELSDRPAKSVEVPAPQPSRQHPPLKTGPMKDFEKYEHSPSGSERVSTSTRAEGSPSSPRQSEEPSSRETSLDRDALASTTENAGKSSMETPSAEASDAGGDGASSVYSQSSRGSVNSLPGSPPPTPPAKHPARLRPMSKQVLASELPAGGEELINAPLPELPSAKEHPSTSDGSPQLKSSDSAVDDHGEDEDNIYLQSTPFTMTKPLFKHGPITFSKAELGRAALTMDDTMDWTAFQMAILGGAGDLNDEEISGEDEQLSEEISEWFKGLRVDAGVATEDQDKNETEAEAKEEKVQQQDEEEEMASPPGSARSSLSSRSSSLASAESEESQEVKFYRGSAFSKLSAAQKDAVPRGLFSNKDHHQPTPQQQMALQQSQRRRESAIKFHPEESQKYQWGLDLSRTNLEPVVAGADDDGGDAVEQVPMGFNLNQDLGDYLKYQQANAF